jgi:hypothetical protein
MRKRGSAATFKKAKNVKVTREFLNQRHEWNSARGYPKSRWIAFCETLIAAGFHVSLYEAKETLSKYVTISDGDSKYLVRFSNHRPNKRRELAGDCDFFVGVTHTGVRTTDDALEAVSRHFGIDIRSAA